jgi:hypothetical protein
MRLLSPVEEAYLNGTRDFTKAQQRYIRYRLKKKLRLLDESRDAAAAAAAMLLRLESSLVRIPRYNNHHEIVIENKNIVGRKGFEPSIPAMSRRYPNQARPPAQYTH